MNNQMLIGTLATVVNVMFHVGALIALAVVLRKTSRRLGDTSHSYHALVMLTFAVVAIIGVHTAEAWAWAFLYLQLGEFDSLQQALYFSVATATTVGYGDVVMTPDWQLVATFEAMAGFILFGASTAFLLEFVRSLFVPPATSDEP